MGVISHHHRSLRKLTSAKFCDFRLVLKLHIRIIRNLFRTSRTRRTRRTGPSSTRCSCPTGPCCATSGCRTSASTAPSPSSTISAPSGSPSRRTSSPWRRRPSSLTIIWDVEFVLFGLRLNLMKLICSLIKGPIYLSRILTLYICDKTSAKLD